MSEIIALRASILHFLDSPRASGGGYEYFDDGILVVEDGRVARLGPAEAVASELGSDLVVDESMRHCLIMPGMIDTHTHYPQVDIIAAHGKHLLDWLQDYTYPAEQRFSDPEYAAVAADIFLQECFRNGTTTAMVYGSVSPVSVDAFFQAAQPYRARMIAGKVMMDRNAPAALLDTPETSYADSHRLIETWHGTDRFHYAITPRFAPTSSPEQLQQAGRLKQVFPDVYVQSHVSETDEEIRWVRQLFPEWESYTRVYQHFGLLSDHSLLAHGLHLDDSERRLLADSGTGIAFCPTSNLFLGSGLLDLDACRSAGVKLSLATDVGAGTSFSMLRTLQGAYEVARLQGQSMDPLEAFYWITLGNARVLQLDDCIGNFQPGKEADFVVLDPAALPLLQYRLGICGNLSERLFAMMYLGDDRLVDSTWIMGKPVYRKPPGAG